MINKFHVLYVGQIELDNIGRDGTPANERRYSSARLSEGFATARDIAQTMDELGFHALWTAEHHFQREGYEVLPNLIQLGLWLATQTKRLKFGCAFNVLPMWHPIRLAEDYAMADIVTDGRVIMGVGRGYHTREVESFGAPLIDATANREYFEEGLELLLKCFRKPSITRANTSSARRRSITAATNSRRLPSSRDPSTCRSRSGCRSPAARPST
jgi:alkanesulfonate monooxygenase SsuD/methylene tetrahydromethanopterin reductase-like flavin-dependent oxidoreductase (luciferase family)